MRDQPFQEEVFGVPHTAIFSHDRLYRYGLTRFTDGGNGPPGIVNFVMLNPSTADERVDDPTIRRCLGYAKAWGYGTLSVTNLYAWRGTDPKVLPKLVDPIGPENNNHLAMHAMLADKIVCAWGNNAEETVVGWFCRMMGGFGYDLWALGLNKTGMPVHPLYQPKDAVLIPYPGLP